MQPPTVKPEITAENQDYWRFLKAGELRMQRCSACGHVRFPPRWLCPECLSEEYTWDLLSGRGTLYSFVWYMKSLDPRFTEVPYNVAIVRLEEGPHVVTNIEGVTFGELKVGQPVRAVFVDVSDDVAILRFEVDPGA